MELISSQMPIAPQCRVPLWPRAGPLRLRDDIRWLRSPREKEEVLSQPGPGPQKTSRRRWLLVTQPGQHTGQEGHGVGGR